MRAKLSKNDAEIILSIKTQGGETLIFRGDDCNALMREVYAAGEGAGAKLDLGTVIILTDMLECAGNGRDPSDFPWTEFLGAFK
jgi:hypothetical protein